MQEEIPGRLAAIEAELRRIGLWDVPRPERTDGSGAFGGDAMSFEQWLRWVFVPRVHELLASAGPWPQSSAVSSKAHREWRMWGDRPDVDRLIELLGEFDALFVDPRDR
jgi:uncharacterized protein YqcC (DUF446 family)